MFNKQPSAYAAAKMTADVEELSRLFDGTSLNRIPVIKGAGISSPMLFGRWTESKINHATFLVESQTWILLRCIPHNLLTAQMVIPTWKSDTKLEIVIHWPSFFSNMMRQVGFQSNSTEEVVKFDPSHDVFKSIIKYLKQRGESPTGRGPYRFSDWVAMFSVHTLCIEINFCFVPALFHLIYQPALPVLCFLINGLSILNNQWTLKWYLSKC